MPAVRLAVAADRSRLVLPLKVVGLVLALCFAEEAKETGPGGLYFVAWGKEGSRTRRCPGCRAGAGAANRGAVSGWCPPGIPGSDQRG